MKLKHSPAPGLIAASPDLLEALTKMRAEINKLSGQWTERLDTLAQMADAAIAKARGQS